MPFDALVLLAPSLRAEPGSFRVHPCFAALFAELGLTTAEAFLDLPGEVVSGHPDRHVMRVELPGAGAFYLKRQHIVGFRERLRNARAGFGWVSRCAREATILGALAAVRLPAPQWAAVGAHRGRAFLLVEEVPDAVDLRALLSDNTMSVGARRALAATLGRAVAAIHAAGFTTPDLTAKHVLVNPETFAVTFLDWQNATRGAVSAEQRADALGALHASLAGELASPRERLRALAANRAVGGSVGVDAIRHAAAKFAGRRSVREQLAPAAPVQRLVWLAGEAVCVVPEVADDCPRPAIAAPFYGGPAGEFTLRFAGRDAVLVRGHSFAPLGRVRAWLRAMPWRSPGVTIGRVLFHLERHGVPAPRLLAFGQRLTGAARADWFALYEAPRGELLRDWRRTAPTSQRRDLLPALRDCLAKLHAAGCLLGDAEAAFAVEDSRVGIADPRAVRIVRRVSESARRRDQFAVFHLLGLE